MVSVALERRARPSLLSYMRGGKNRSGHCQAQNRVPHAAGKKNASVKSENVGWEPNLCHLSFLCCANRPPGARHWFPADGIGCVPFWLVVSSGANHVKSTIMIVISPKDSINKHGKTMVCVCWLPFNTCLNCLFYREKASWHFRPCFNHFQTGHPT